MSFVRNFVQQNIIEYFTVCENFEERLEMFFELFVLVEEFDRIFIQVYLPGENILKLETPQISTALLKNDY